MKSAVAILTYNRVEVLKTLLDGVVEHILPKYPMAIFDDCSNKDGTHDYLRSWTGNKFTRNETLMADEYAEGPFTTFIGHRNLGVAKSSNKALWWFMNRTQCDHLILMNDDLHVTGDFVADYSQAHHDLDINLFCLCDFDSETHRGTIVSYRGYLIKILNQLTGIMMSITKKVVEDIGYFDIRFPKFGEEHCDYSYRAKAKGHTRIDDKSVNAIDLVLEKPKIHHQEVKPTIDGIEREILQIEASRIMQKIRAEYPFTDHYRPFSLRSTTIVGGYANTGINVKDVQGAITV
jgi:GT2 family glycosyltransferase